jgi:hypothetical protein
MHCLASRYQHHEQYVITSSARETTFTNFSFVDWFETVRLVRARLILLRLAVTVNGMVTLKA